MENSKGKWNETHQKHKAVRDEEKRNNRPARGELKKWGEISKLKAATIFLSIRNEREWKTQPNEKNENKL